MGKHSAQDGATVHPLVADALERRQPGRAHVAGAAAAPRSADVGWPTAPGRGEGLGWPGGGPAEPEARDPEDDGSVLAVLEEAAAQEEAVADTPSDGGQPVRKQGWRRFFGGGGSGRSTSAA